MGVHAILKRYERRPAATYRLGRDPSVPWLPRMLARLISCYERARMRAAMVMLLDALPLFDGPPLWLARRIVFALARRPRGDHDVTLDGVELPGSGWGGNLLALGCWLAALTGLVLVVTRLGGSLP